MKMKFYFRLPTPGTLIEVAAIALLLLLFNGCEPGGPSMDEEGLHDFARRYTAAWCSQDAASVAAFYAGNGSLKINDGVPSVGREAITEAAQGFMTAFPDMAVLMDDVSFEGNHAIYRWTLIGTNTGPRGTGNAVRISGFEQWNMGEDGLIAASKGNFDEAEYQRQLEHGAGETDL